MKTLLFPPRQVRTPAYVISGELAVVTDSFALIGHFLAEALRALFAPAKELP
jgi:hypothetical protein